MKKNTSVANIGNRIRQKRKELHIRQKEMAEALGIAPAYLSEIENGKGNPGPDIFIKLSTIYGIDLNYLFLGTEGKPDGNANSTGSIEIDLNDGIGTVEQLVWLTEQSLYIRNSVLAAVSRFILDNSEVIQSILNNKSNKEEKK